MALVTGTIAVIWQGTVYMVNRNLAKKLIKMGYKYLTSKNYKKSFDFFKGKKKLNTSEKNKVLEKLNIKPKKISPKKTKLKQEPNPWKGIRKNETIEQFLARKAKDSKTILSKETKKIIENVKKARAKDKTIVKATETEQAKTLVQAAKADKLPAPISKVKETLAKGTEVAAPAVKGSTAWEKAKTAMKIAGWSFVGLGAGGILFHELGKEKEVEPKVTVDLKSDVTTAEDATVTTAKPEIKIPPMDKADPFFKKRDTLADKIQSLDTKDFEVITPDHPLVSKDIIIPGYTRERVDTGN